MQFVDTEVGITEGNTESAFVGSALLILVGVQLVISWILMRVLERLSEREAQTEEQFGRMTHERAAA